jgi:hypothetical protein
MTKSTHARASLVSAIAFAFSFAVAVVLVSGPIDTCDAGDHYALFNPYDPRPDFFRLPVYNAWVPYRKSNNRPTYIGGKVAAVIEPTSQEAMAWQISKANGNYRNHRPGSIPTYYYPKPWEALQIGARQRKSLELEPSQMEPSPIESNPGLAPEPLSDVN